MIIGCGCLDRAGSHLRPALLFARYSQIETGKMLSLSYIMTPVKRRYTKRIFKGLLTAAYILFFTVQFNPRYYSIANFFQYQTKKAATLSLIQHQPDGKSGPAALLQKAPDASRAHLSLDKRYRVKQAAAIASVHSVRTYFITFSHRKIPVPEEDLPSSDTSIPSLRGPPCA